MTESYQILSCLFKVKTPIIITTLTAQIPDKDRRIYGWHDKVQQLDSVHQQPTLEQFIQHIKSQVLPVTHTRKQAYTELLSLQTNNKNVPDCVALGTKFRQLFSQVFPSGDSQEVAPATKLNCCQAIHRTLLELTKSPFQNKLVKAWQDHTGYNASLIFAAYLKESLHADGSSDILSESYLTLVEENCHHPYRGC